jgi:chaperone required for assembly of F1-ATPase
MIPRKRFWQAATVGPENTVLLDGKALPTPAGKRFQLPTGALATAIAAEWQAQGEQIQPHTLPLYQLAVTALDKVAADPQSVAAEMVRYAGSDLVCYRAAEPADLVVRQQALWQPLLDWLALHYDALLVVTTGIMPIAQPPNALAALERAVASLDLWRLTALAFATSTAGSLTVALALKDRLIDVDGAFEAAELDASFEIARWGEDDEATERRARVRADLAAARRLLDLLDQA